MPRLAAFWFSIARRFLQLYRSLPGCSGTAAGNEMDYLGGLPEAGCCICRPKELLWHYDCSSPVMENTFDINYQDQPVKVDYQAGETPNEHLFTVQLPDGPLSLQCKKDNEGAFQWLDENDKATDTTRAIGDSIETYLLEHSITL